MHLIIKSHPYSLQKISPVSRQGLFTTQTQNKTRQNYYAILPVYAGGGICTNYGYSHIHKQRQADLHVINKCGEAFVYFLYVKKFKIIILIECLSHEASTASSMQSVKYLQYLLPLSSPALRLPVSDRPTPLLCLRHGDLQSGSSASHRLPFQTH